MNKPGKKTNNPLTLREAEVLRLLYLKGNPYDEAARQLHISPETVRTHAHKIYSKLDVKNCIQAGLKYFRNEEK